MTFLSLINLLWYSLKKQLGLQLYKKKKTLLQVFSIKISQTFIHAPEKNIAALWKSLVFSVTSSFLNVFIFHEITTSMDLIGSQQPSNNNKCYH